MVVYLSIKFVLLSETVKTPKMFNLFSFKRLRETLKITEKTEK